MQSLREMWLTVARQNPDQTAIVFGEKRLTYKQLIERAHRLGHALYGLGVRPQSRVSVLAMNCAEWFDVYAACNLAGFIVGTVNFRLAPREMDFILRDSSPTVLIFEEKYTDIVDGLRAAHPSIQSYVCIGSSTPPWAQSFEALVATADPSGAPTAAHPDDPAHLMYTSGTTGRPKGVIRSQRAEVRAADRIALGLELDWGAPILVMMPLFHIGAFGAGLAQIFRGGTVVIHREFSPVEILRTIERERVAATHMAPTIVQDVLNVPGILDYDLSSLRTISYAAAPMPVSVLIKGIDLLGSNFIDMYGSTELCCVTALHKHRHVLEGPADEVKRLGSVGQPLPDVRIRIVNDDGEEKPRNEIGEISVQSPMMMDEYWSNSAATHDAIRDGWFLTGDVGFMDEQDFLYLVDRKKDMIISGAENIYCREVEEALMQVGNLSDVAVIGVPDARWGESVRAIVIRKPGSQVTERELIDFCRTMIAPYKCPKSIVFVDEFPRLASGKVSKVSLRELHGSA